MPYNRPWKSRSDQLALLKSRGLEVTDDEAAKDKLSKIGYYRLSGYWYPFRQTGWVNGKHTVLDNFREGSRFQDAVELYVFDKKLRLIALDALERIEVAIRVEIAHTLGERDTFAHQNGTNLDGRFTQSRGRRSSLHEGWLERYDRLLDRSKEDFIDHYKQRHGLPLPIWVSIEIWDFGTMSILYSGMKGKDRDAIAKKFGATDGRYMSSWLRALNNLRNVCAHHSRLWNKNILEQPKFPKGEDAGDLINVSSSKLIARPFALFCILQTLMREICPNSNWHERFKEHVTNFPKDNNDLCSLKQMGCPDNWEEWTLWS